MHILHSRYVYFKCNYSRRLLSIITFRTPSVCKTTVFETTSSVRAHTWSSHPDFRWRINSQSYFAPLISDKELCPLRVMNNNSSNNNNSNNNEERTFTMSDICIHKYHSKNKCQKSLSTRYWNQIRVGGTEGVQNKLSQITIKCQLLSPNASGLLVPFWAGVLHKQWQLSITSALQVGENRSRFMGRWKRKNLPPEVYFLSCLVHVTEKSSTVKKDG